ncbi:MAG TPA: hypothetical protein DEO66_07795 [Marinobacter adhaerens]|nr:hypothetical protein [Marinobacter adhaerens]
MLAVGKKLPRLGIVYEPGFPLQRRLWPDFRKNRQGMRQNLYQNLVKLMRLVSRASSRGEIKTHR